MKTLRGLTAILTLLVSIVIAFAVTQTNGIAAGLLTGGLTWFLAGNALARPTSRLCATFTNLDDELFSASALEAFLITLLPFQVFSRDFSPSPMTKRGQTVLVPLIASLTATTFGGTYAISGGTASVVTVTINKHKHVPIGEDDITAANSSRANLEIFAAQQGKALALAVLTDVFTGMVLTSNFSLATAVASTAIDVPQLRAARLQMNKANVPMDPRSMILDCDPYDTLLGITAFTDKSKFLQPDVLAKGAVNYALGFQFFELNNLFSVSAMGFAAHASAIAIAMRYLKPQDGNTYRDAHPITDPETGITIGLRDHYDNNTGSRYVNLECNYGYSVGLSNGGRIIKRTD